MHISSPHLSLVITHWGLTVIHSQANLFILLLLGSDRLVSHSIRSADSPLYNTEGQGANGSQNSEYQQLVVEQQSLTVVKGCGSCYRLQEIQNNITGKSGLKRYCSIIGQFTDNLGIIPLPCKSNTHLIHVSRYIHNLQGSTLQYLNLNMIR